MIWTKQTPTEVGWYWKREPLRKYGYPEIVCIRDYAGELALGNSPLSGWKGVADYEWAGPIPLPFERCENTGDVKDE